MADLPDLTESESYQRGVASMLEALTSEGGEHVVGAQRFPLTYRSPPMQLQAQSLTPLPFPGAGGGRSFAESIVALLKQWAATKNPAPVANYNVQVTNGSSDTFTELNIFYKRLGQPGVVFLTYPNVVPLDTKFYDLGPCPQMESYVVGFFIGEELVAKIPSSGNMTPQLATALSPTDQNACADSWRITD